jgi:cytochrome c553
MIEEQKRAKRSPLRAAVVWTARVTSGLLSLVLAALAIVYVMSEHRLHKRYEVPVHAVAFSADSTTIARGAKLAQLRGCTECHGSGLAGTVVFNNPLIGRIAAANLTRGKGGRGGTLTAEDWERAIRHGLRRDGSTLVVMPAQEFQGLTDQDVGALIAFGQSRPPVDNELPSQRYGPVGRALFVAGQIPLIPAEAVDQHKPHALAVDTTQTVEYGAYLAATCTGCHGQNLSGGRLAHESATQPVALNLTPDTATGIGAWTEQEFVKTLRTGTRPDGKALDGNYMPWKSVGQMSDKELHAIYGYLRTLPPRRFGNH